MGSGLGSLKVVSTGRGLGDLPKKLRNLLIFFKFVMNSKDVVEENKGCLKRPMFVDL